VLCQSVEEAARKFLAEEGNVGLDISVSRQLARTSLILPSSRQVEEHHSVRHLQSRNDSTSILICHWMCACACEVVSE
jgi:hypothetical protein